MKKKINTKSVKEIEEIFKVLAKSGITPETAMLFLFTFMMQNKSKAMVMNMEGDNGKNFEVQLSIVENSSKILEDSKFPDCYKSMVN